MTNTSITATEAKNRFSDMVDLARAEPITITRNDKAVAIVLSPAEYARLLVSDDAYWGDQAEKAKQSGAYLSIKESEDFLNAILNAPDSST